MAEYKSLAGYHRMYKSRNDWDNSQLECFVCGRKTPIAHLWNKDEPLTTETILLCDDCDSRAMSEVPHG